MKRMQDQAENPGEPAIGFIGQGYIGKNYADDFERRGHAVVRYALEEPYRANRERVGRCEIVFIGVPTPTTVAGFDDSIVREAIALTKPGAVVVIKSTILPGKTAALQEAYSDRIFLYSPEFLSEKTAAIDAAHPFSNIIGIARDTPAHRRAAERILALLPEAPFSRVMSSTEAEIVKYAHNGSGYMQIVFFNLMYDLAAKLGVGWEAVGAALKADPMISSRYSTPVHASGHPGATQGRGAGGHCFIKDFASLREVYERSVADPAGVSALTSIEGKNIALLKESGKDLDLLEGVYGASA